ncbi:MAG TPA: lysylphosphatidylglycerol synthase transmembrane domain-containing protein [Solirubrobacteraceae bacterium]|nr:lysylphosphatidylglycerol synthase transmembrane domain-containing protein [Solirubrobacteraceae bacterium]
MRLLRFLRAHPVAVTVAAIAIATVAVVAIASAYGWAAFGQAWSALQPGWIVLVVAGELAAMPAYAVAYRVLAERGGGPRLSFPLVLRVVAAGFGLFSVRGGFSLDKRAFHSLEGDEESATVRVLALGALEWALLAPVAWITAVILLVQGDPKPMTSLLWPWAVLVPVGFVVGFWFAAPARRERLCGGRGRVRRAIGEVLRGIDMVRELARDIGSTWPAWVAAGLYWAFDIASFYGAARFIGLHLTVGEAVLAYATGYALTRRSMPMGGAGATEVLMTFSLHWVGQPVPLALATVVVYRVFNFLVPAVLALLVRPRVAPLLAASSEGRTPTERERRDAGAPLGIGQR